MSIKNLIFWLSITFIVLFVLGSLLFWLLPLEITNENLAWNLGVIRLLGLPTAIVLALSSKNKSDETAENKKWKTREIIVITSFTTLFLMFISFDGSMCRWTITKEYINKKNPSISMIERYYGCGAYDGDMPKYKLYSVSKLNNVISWMPEVDLENINENEWEIVVK